MLLSRHSPGNDWRVVVCSVWGLLVGLHGNGVRLAWYSQWLWRSRETLQWSLRRRFFLVCWEGVIGLGHQRIVWCRMCMQFAGMVGLVAFGDVYVKIVVRPCGSILAWRDRLAGVGSSMWWWDPGSVSPSSHVMWCSVYWVFEWGVWHVWCQHISLQSHRHRVQTRWVASCAFKNWGWQCFGDIHLQLNTFQGVVVQWCPPAEDHTYLFACIRRYIHQEFLVA